MSTFTIGVSLVVVALSVVAVNVLRHGAASQSAYVCVLPNGYRGEITVRPSQSYRPFISRNGVIMINFDGKGSATVSQTDFDKLETFGSPTTFAYANGYRLEVELPGSAIKQSGPLVRSLRYEATVQSVFDGAKYIDLKDEKLVGFVH